MKKTIFILLILTIQAASAQIVINMNPETLLPNDIAECKLTFTPYKETYVSGITITHPPEVEVYPSSVSGVGWISSYEFPFTVKVKKSGIYTLTIYIKTLNGTVKQTFTLRVLNRMPDIVLDETLLILNEVNTVHFTVTSPINIDNVVVEPLFEANPKIIYVKDNRGEFKFEPKESKDLKFKISFYNGKNYHEIIRTLHVRYMKSKGILINVSPRYPTSLIADVIPIDVEIANLRCDTIYSVNVTISDGTFSRNSIQIPMIEAKKVVKLDFKFSPKDHGEKKIRIRVDFRDEFNHEHRCQKVITMKVLNETTLCFGDLELEPTFEGLSLRGEICNNGKSKAYNIYVIAETEGISRVYYIDCLDPSDFDTFGFTFKNYSEINLKVKWCNEIGECFEIFKTLNPPKYTAKSESDLFPLVSSLSVLAFVIILILLGIRHARRTGRKESKED